MQVTDIPDSPQLDPALAPALAAAAAAAAVGLPANASPTHGQGRCDSDLGHWDLSLCSI